MRVFISYSRRDRVFAEALQGRLADEGHEVSMDLKDLLPGDEWAARLEALVADSDVLAFVVSPHSIRSENCLWELDRALAHGKEVIPIIWRMVPKADIPAALARFNYVRFDSVRVRGLGSSAAFEAALEAMRVALSLDQVKWSRQLGPWVRRASAWEAAPAESRHGFLLQAQEIGALQALLNARTSDSAQVPELVFAYLTASLEREKAEREELLRRERRISIYSQQLAVRAAKDALAEHRWDRALRLCLSAVPTDEEQDRTIPLTPVLEAAIAAAAQGSPLVAIHGRSRYPPPPYYQQGRLDPSQFPSDRLPVSYRAAMIPMGDGRWADYSEVTVGRDGRELQVRHDSRGLLRIEGRFEDREFVHEIALGPIHSIYASLDCATVLTVSYSDKSVSTWDSERGVEISRETDKTILTNFGLLAVSATHGAGRSGDDFVLWELDRPESPRILRGHERGPRLAEFSADGRLLLTSSFDGSTRLWDVGRGEPVGEPVRHVGDAAARFSPDNSLYAIAFGRGLDIRDTASRRRIAMFACGRWMGDVAFSPNARRIFGLGDHGSIAEWDLGTGKPVWDAPAGAVETAVGEAGRLAQFFQDGSGWRLEVSGRAEPVRIELPAGELPSEAIFSNDEGELRWRSRSDDLSVAPRDYSTNLDSGETIGLAGPAAAAESDSGWTVQPFGAGKIQLKRAGEPAERRLLLEGHGPALATSRFRWRGTAVDGSIPVRSWSVCPDTRSLLTTGSDGLVKVWDLADGRLLATCAGHSDAVLGAAYSPSRARLLSWSADRSIRIWCARSGVEIEALRHEDKEIRFARWIGNELLVAVFKDGSMAAWDTVWLAAVTGNALVRAALEHRLAGCEELEEDEKSLLRQILGFTPQELFPLAPVPGEDRLAFSRVERWRKRIEAPPAAALSDLVARVPEDDPPVFERSHCLFCRAPAREARLLIQGKGAAICDECVVIAKSAIEEAVKAGALARHRGGTDVNCAFCGISAHEADLIISGGSGRICADCVRLCQAEIAKIGDPEGAGVGKPAS